MLCAAAAVYFGVRVVVEGSTESATHNAERLLTLERALSLDVESKIQRAVIDIEVLRTLGNFSYVWLHWPLLIAVLFVVLHRDPGRYHQLRGALFLSGAVGLVLFTIYPMAPPRFMPGFIGTVSDEARRHFVSYPLSWTNRYAAFPSFHAGWTLIACLALAATMRTRAGRTLALVPAALVTMAVITTGNHYVIDTATGIVVAVGAYGVAGRRRRIGAAATRASTPLEALAGDPGSDQSSPPRRRPRRPDDGRGPHGGVSTAA